MTTHDLAILAEHFTASAHVTRSGWADIDTLDIAEYVDKAFAGCVVDDLDEPNYLVGPVEAVTWRKHAFTVIVHALQARYRRPLNGRDLALVSMAVVDVWERKAEQAKGQCRLCGIEFGEGHHHCRRAKGRTICLDCSAFYDGPSEREIENIQEAVGQQRQERQLRDGTDGGLSTSERTALKQSGRMK